MYFLFPFFPKNLKGTKANEAEKQVCDLWQVLGLAGIPGWEKWKRKGITDHVPIVEILWEVCVQGFDHPFIVTLTDTLSHNREPTLGEKKLICKTIIRKARKITWCLPPRSLSLHCFGTQWSLPAQAIRKMLVTRTKLTARKMTKIPGPLSPVDKPPEPSTIPLQSPVPKIPPPARSEGLEGSQQEGKPITPLAKASFAHLSPWWLWIFPFLLGWSRPSPSQVPQFGVAFNL